MKDKTVKKRFLPNGKQKNPKFSLNKDPFFNPEAKRRRKIKYDDEVIDSDLSEDEADGRAGEGDVSEEDVETADEKRLRVAKAYLEKIREITKREKEEEDEEGEGSDEEVGEGKRDSLVAEILQQEQLEESGRVQRLIAARVQKPEEFDKFQILQRHRQTVTAVALDEDDSKGFSASKDGIILHWDVESGKSEKYMWPNKDTLITHGAKNPQNPSTKWSRHILSLAVSSDGRILATGGFDRHIHLWDTRTREHIQAFPGHRGAVSCLAFRQGTSQLISGSFDRTIKLWNAEDRVYMDTLFGHQSEVLTVDCLRKERILTSGRDRTMHLYKVPEESQLVYRAPASSIECSCFINNEEFISGSDDGSIELWSILRKKPTFIAKNAHPALAPQNKLDAKESGKVSNGEKTENGHSKADSSCSAAESWVGSIAVCRGSDLAASGAANGTLRLWAIESDTKSIRPLHDLPLVGFVNALAFAKSGRFLVAGVGQEPRLGRWGHISAARNGVALQRLKLSEEGPATDLDVGGMDFSKFGGMEGIGNGYGR